MNMSLNQTIKVACTKIKSKIRIKLATAAALLATLSLLLTSCGGSSEFPPVITGVKVQSISYGRTATIYLGGQDLRSSMVVDTGGACASPNFATSSTTAMLVLNCVPKVAGDIPLTIKSAEGAVVYSGTLSVPNPQVTLITAKGAITLELDPTIAPITTNNFLSYVASGFYKDTLFHRVIAGFVIQGGGYVSGMLKRSPSAPAIELETNKGLSNLRGTLAMARTNVPNSATSEFFINLVDNTSLDYKNAASPGYAVFGKVVQGMELVDAIAAEPTGVVKGFADVPLTDVLVSLAIQSR
jgi:cyclophilin family peptidyl-prolyl cis-trans isomerase